MAKWMKRSLWYVCGCEVYKNTNLTAVSTSYFLCGDVQKHVDHRCRCFIAWTVALPVSSRLRQLPQRLNPMRSRRIPGRWHRSLVKMPGGGDGLCMLYPRANFRCQRLRCTAARASYFQNANKYRHTPFKTHGRTGSVCRTACTRLVHEEN